MEHNILVLSDSHGLHRNISEVLARQVRRPDMLLFLGDGLRDLDRVDTEGISVLAVRGNCDCYLDPMPRDPDERLLTVGNVTICMMHGHTYNVKNGRTVAAAHAARQGADILLFGHTHETVEDHLPAGLTLGGVPLTKPLTVFNPGTVGNPRNATFGIITIRNGTFLCSHGKL